MRKPTSLSMNYPALLGLVVTLALPITTSAADPVDLRGKQGVVDPKDLKKSDPPQKGLKTKEPPSPDTRSDKEKAKAKEPRSVSGVRD